MDSGGPAHLHTIATLVARLRVLPTAQVRNLTSIPKTCQGHSQIQNWPRLPPFALAAGGAWTWPPFFCLPPSATRPAGLLPSLAGTRETYVLIPQPSLLHTVQESVTSSHMFLLEAMNSVPGCANLPPPSTVHTTGHLHCRYLAKRSGNERGMHGRQQGVRPTG